MQQILVMIIVIATIIYVIVKLFRFVTSPDNGCCKSEQCSNCSAGKPGDIELQDLKRNNDLEMEKKSE